MQPMNLIQSHSDDESVVERLTLTARVERDDTRFVARIEGIPPSVQMPQGEGESADSAWEELVQAMISWISSHDCSESMAGVLAEAGFPPIDDHTELELEFVPDVELGQEP